ncbi:MAG: hypothetical protein Fur002_18000 [Anaerolineales bacterium]
MIIATALLIAYLVPLLFLFGIRRFDLYGTGKFWFNGLTLAWGVVAYALAAQINPAMRNSGLASYEMVVRVTAPILEEFLKALILVYIVQRADFNYIVDGALYGFGAGIGFAMIENTEYVLGHPESALIVAAARVFSTNLVHATGSGVIGTALAYWRGDRSWRGWLAILLGYAFSMPVHMAFNTMVNEGVPLIIAIAYGFIGVAVIWYAIRRGMNIQKRWVGEKLGMGDRVTDSEAKAVTNINDLDDLLEPLRKEFGKEKAETVKTIISKQAEIGIKRKLMDSAFNEDKRREIERVIQSISAEMDVLRRQAGPYCMMFVRTVYLDQDIKIWDRINLRVEAASTGQKGGGLYDRVSARIQRKPADSSSEEKQP